MGSIPVCQSGPNQGGNNGKNRDHVHVSVLIGRDVPFFFEILGLIQGRGVHETITEKIKSLRDEQIFILGQGFW